MKDQRWVEQFSSGKDSPIISFANEFDESSIKVTDGRCQLYVIDQCIVDQIRELIDSKFGHFECCHNFDNRVQSNKKT